MPENNTKARLPEELTVSSETREELIRYLHLSSRIGQSALAELIVSEGNSTELAAQMIAKPELRIPSV